MINFDANANHTLLPEVREALRRFPKDALNPSSVHQGGQRARALVEEAREEIRQLLNLTPGDKVVFTSGATEANNTAVLAPFWKYFAKSRGMEPLGNPAIVSSAIEHPSVLEPIKRLERMGIKSALLSPNQNGSFEAGAFLSACSTETKLLSLMLANNETGQILDVAAITRAVKAKFPGLIVHCDAVQAVGKLKFEFSALGTDLMSISAHKLGGLAGSGALIIKEGLQSEALLCGGVQELGLRAGTENVLGIVAFGVAARVLRQKLSENITALQQNRDFLVHYLRENIADAVFNLYGPACLPNTVSLRIPAIKADDLVVALDLEGVCTASGAACAAGKPEPSHVLLAMGLSREQAASTIRISLEACYRPGDLELGARKIVECVKRMRRPRNN